jgi:STE24 endopeptidase
MSESTPVVLDPQRQGKARRYAALHRRLALATWALSGAYLGAWVVFGWGPAIERTLLALGSSWRVGVPWWLALLAVAAAVGLPFGLIYLPLEYYGGFVLPHRFQLSTQDLRGWLTDMAKGAVLSAVIGSPLLIGLYALVRLSPGEWWLWSALGYSAVSLGLSAVAPVILMPIFFKFRPLDQAHAALNERLLALARRAHTHVRGIFTFDMSRRTRAANAALVGLGRTRRVILGDTLLSEFEPEEIETVLAHELGHHVHMDIPLFVLVQTGINLLTFFLIAAGARWAVTELGLTSLADPGGLPAVALLAGILSTIIGPFANAFSRWREALADRYSLELTHSPAAFVSAMTRLANQNLGEADPPRWAVLLFATHPPLGQRIRQAGAFGESTPD